MDRIHTIELIEGKRERLNPDYSTVCQVLCCRAGSGIPSGRGGSSERHLLRMHLRLRCVRPVRLNAGRLFDVSGVAVMAFRSTTAWATKLVSSLDCSPLGRTSTPRNNGLAFCLNGFYDSVDDVRNWLRAPISGGQSATALPRYSDVNLLGDREGVIDLDAEVSDRALHLGVPEEQLNRAEVPGSPIDQGRLGSPQ
jgi:hypothetical protein